MCDYACQALYFKHHSRIKILNKNGFGWADVEIPRSNKINFEKLNEINESVTEIFVVEFIGSAQFTGDLLYFNPFILERWEENLLKLEERKYPVDFTYPFNETYICIYNF